MDDQEPQWFVHSKDGFVKPVNESPVSPTGKVTDKALFARAKLPFATIRQLEALPPGALALYLLIETLATMRGTGYALEGYVRVSRSVARIIGIEDKSKRGKLLTAMEAAGVVDVIRKPNKAPLCRLKPKRTSDSLDEAKASAMDHDDYEDVVLHRAGGLDA